MTDQFDNKAAELLPCICLPAYNDRGLAQPDCPRCNYGDYVGDALREVDKAARAENDGAYRQLLSLAQAAGYTRIWEDLREGRSGEWFMEREGEPGRIEVLPFSAYRQQARAEGYVAGIEAAAKAIEEPYQERWFSPLSEVELELASKTLQKTQTGLIDRLHAGWARHWAGLIRALLCVG